MNYLNLTNDQQTKIVNYCLSCLNFEDYDEPATIENLFKIFEIEKCYDLKRYGYKDAFIGWMQGLPSLLDVEFYYHKIMPILDFWSVDYDEDADDMGIIFFSLVADCFLTMKESRKEPFYKWIGVTFDELLQAIENEEYILKEQLLPYKDELLKTYYPMEINTILGQSVS